MNDIINYIHGLASNLSLNLFILTENKRLIKLTFFEIKIFHFYADKAINLLNYIEKCQKQCKIVIPRGFSIM